MLLLHSSSSESEDQSTLLPVSHAHQPSLAVHPRVYLLQTGSPDILMNPWHFTTVVFHPCCRHDIETTAAVFCLSSSTSTGTTRSTLYSRPTGVASCRRQHVERPSARRHIYTVTRGLQTASQDFPLPSFLYTRTS